MLFLVTWLNTFHTPLDFVESRIYVLLDRDSLEIWLFTLVILYKRLLDVLLQKKISQRRAFFSIRIPKNLRRTHRLDIKCSWLWLSVDHHVICSVSSWQEIHNLTIWSKYFFFWRVTIFWGINAMSESGFRRVLTEVLELPHGCSFTGAIGVVCSFKFVQAWKHRHPIWRLEHRLIYILIWMPGLIWNVSRNVAIKLQGLTGTGHRNGRSAGREHGSTTSPEHAQGRQRSWPHHAPNHPIPQSI